MAFKINHKTKISLISLAIILALAAGGIITIMFIAKGAVNNFRTNAARQLNNVIASKDAGATVELETVWLGRTVSNDYKKVDSLQNEYRNILIALKNYVAVLDVHNKLVGEYNKGLKGEDIINGDLLKLVKKYRDLIANKFPKETDRIKAVDDLTERILGTSDFDSISGFMSEVISDNDDWLNEIRDGLNNQISAFQKKIN